MSYLYNTDPSHKSLADVLACLEREDSNGKTVFDLFEQEHEVEYFNGLLLVVRSDIPDDYSFVIATVSRHNKATITRKFHETYGHVDATTFAIKLTSDGMWGVIDIEDYTGVVKPANYFRRMEAVNAFMSILVSRFLRTREGVYACVKNALSYVKQNIGVCPPNPLLVREYAETACDINILSYAWVDIIQQLMECPPSIVSSDS